MKFLFWNIKNKSEADIGDALINMISTESPDILLLAETNIDDSFFLNNCSMTFRGSAEKTNNFTKTSAYLKIYSKKPIKIIKITEYGNGEMLVCRLDKDGSNYLIFGCHFPSKLFLQDEDARLSSSTKYREFIEETEKRLKNRLVGSIIFGDFNSNPLEKFFTSSLGLFAIDVSKPFPRKINKCNFFVNPMLSAFGSFKLNHSHSSKPSGTYYYSRKDLRIPHEYHWNMIDGLFFRKELFDLYDENEPLEIIGEIKDDKNNILHSLFTKNKIDPKYSDHLPIKFKFKI